MSFRFARRMEREALRKAKSFRDELWFHGVKPWYSYAGLFDERATRVFVGLNPGGTGESEELDERYGSWPYHKRRKREYCAWIDEQWEGGGGGLYAAGESPLQKRTHKAFRAMYGTGWRKVIRSTPCFNVVPFRTRSSEKLTPRAWEAAQPWFNKVLKHLRPELIICNGNVEGLSPWAVLCKTEYESIVVRRKAKTCAVAASIKIATVSEGSLKGAKIVALPHLSRFGGEDLFRKLRELREARPDLFV